ncbi:MAG: Rpn family recombination-promoting nuclease/putative transposase [Bacteroidales bacterium]|nr:Rpn family recombination-promoting nuclease/putative transposase [Bacteroidales bacterium]
MIDDRRERYINPYTDFGFKKLFGTAMNKPLLIGFLNALLEGKEKPIIDIHYLNTEHLGEYAGNRSSIFDVYCQADDGSHFIVEMQKGQQHYFKDRTVYYAASVIREQAPKGAWDYHLQDVYTVSLLNFNLPENKFPDDSYRHEVVLMDKEFMQVFYDKLTFIYLEMPKFNKTEDELDGLFEKWMFVLKNLYRLLDRPAALQEKVFTMLFEAAEIARFTPEEQIAYEESVKVFRDNANVADFAVEQAEKKARAEGEAKGRAEGEAKGRAEEKLENARKMKELGASIDFITQVTGLSIEEIRKL